MVIGDDGKLFWIIDAYTESSNLPYSKPLQNGTNYIRNSVKVVVDAYDGSVAFYVVDAEGYPGKDVRRGLSHALQAGFRDASGPEEAHSLSRVRCSRSRRGCSRRSI